MTSDTRISRRRLLRDASVSVGAAVVGASGASQATATGSQTAGSGRRRYRSASQTVREVSFMSPGTVREQQMYQEAIAAAQAATLDALNIKINWFAAPGGDWDRIMTMFAAGEAYDIQRIDDDRVYLLAVENKIHQLDQWILDPEIGIEADQYYPRFFSSIAIEGYQFSMIPASSANVVYYNRDHFDRAGIEAPTSWSDAWDLETFVENVRALAAVSGSYGVGFPGNVTTPIGYGAGATALNDNQTACAFDTDDVAAALDPFVKLIVEDQVATPPEVVPLEMFNAGLSSMTWGAMDLVSGISEDIQWGIMPWCKTPLYAMTENYDRAWVISKTAPDPEAAYIALKALTEKPASDVYARWRYGVPNLIAAAEGEAFNDPALPPEHKNVWTETFGSVNDHPVDLEVPRGPIGDAWKSAFAEADLFGALFSGQMTSREFVDQACARVNDEIARQGWSTEVGLQRLMDSGALTNPDAKVLK